MQRRIREYIEKHQMIQKNDRIIAGVSGGADSICLFWNLQVLKKELDIEIAVVHVNHMLRGTEADADEKFVTELCRQQGILCKVYRYPIREIAAKEKISEEEAGRKMRYQAFEHFAKEWKADKIALAHHKNDCAETMLYNMARGTGISGLCSLRPVRNSLIRPLLCMNREEIEQYLEEKNLPYRNDSTNQSVDYTRNKIRHQILPPLQSVNEKAVEHMAFLAEDLEAVQDYLAKQENQLFDRFVHQEEKRLIISAELQQQEPLLGRMVIQHCLEVFAGTKKDFTRNHIRAVWELPKKGTGKQLNLPYEIIASSSYGEIRLEHKSNSCRGQTGKYAQVNLCGVTEYDGWRLECEILEKYEKRIPQKSYTKWIDYDKIKTILTVRNRLPGDFIVINENGGKKKLKDFFIDSKIPKEERDRIVLVADGSEIVWIIGYRLSQRYLVGDDTGKVLQIKGGTIHE